MKKGHELIGVRSMCKCKCVDEKHNLRKKNVNKN